MSPVCVSISVCTYNHEKYIERCIESIANQKVNFPFEVIIADDASTDRTQELIKSLAQKYNWIVPIIRKKNMGTPHNGLDSLQYVNGKYIAFLDGDDYWIDKDKLQLQYDLMETKPNISCCFTNTDVYFEENHTILNKKLEIWQHDQEITFNDFRNNYNFSIPTLTMFFRKSALPKPFPQFMFHTKYTDFAFSIFFLTEGNIYYIHRSTGMYREHSAGITKSLNKIDGLLNGLNLAKNLNDFTNRKFQDYFLNFGWRYERLAYEYFYNKKFLSGMKYTFKYLFIEKKLKVVFLKTVLKILFKNYQPQY